MVKNILTRNAGYKILALVLAVIMWMAVINAEDPVIKREFSSITVTEVNADVITAAGKAYSYVDGINKVNVSVSGRTSIVNGVTREDILATVDLSKLSDTTGAVPVDVSCDRYPSLEVSTEGSSGILRIEIEDLVEKSLNVQVETSGSVASDKYIGKGTATPNLVTVSGPRSEVDIITSAVAGVSVNEQNTADITTNTELQLLNENGREVNSSLLSISESNISVKVPVYNTKTVPLELEIKGNPPEGYRLASSEYEPKSVTIAGPDDLMKQVSGIVLNDYDISGKTEKTEDSLVISENLKEALPEKVVLTDPAAAIALAIDIEKSGEGSFMMPLDQIELVGKSDFMVYNLSTEQSHSNIELLLKGSPQALDSLKTDEIKAELDVSGLHEGEHELEVALTLPKGLTLVGEAKINVKISEE